MLIIGSGFTTACRSSTIHHPMPPRGGWSTEFDAWTPERFAVGDLDALIDFRAKASRMPYADPTIEYFSPLFVFREPRVIRSKYHGRSSTGV